MTRARPHRFATAIVPDNHRQRLEELDDVDRLRIIRPHATYRELWREYARSTLHVLSSSAMLADGRTRMGRDAQTGINGAAHRVEARATPPTDVAIGSAAGAVGGGACTARGRVGNAMYRCHPRFLRWTRARCADLRRMRARCAGDMELCCHSGAVFGVYCQRRARRTRAARVGDGEAFYRPCTLVRQVQCAKA